MLLCAGGEGRGKEGVWLVALRGAMAHGRVWRVAAGCLREWAGGAWGVLAGNSTWLWGGACSSSPLPVRQSVAVPPPHPVGVTVSCSHGECWAGGGQGRQPQGAVRGAGAGGGKGSRVVAALPLPLLGEGPGGAGVEAVLD